MILCLQMVTKCGQITSRSSRMLGILHRKCVKSSPISFQNFRTIKTTLTSYAERMYTDKHEWVLIDGKMGTVGISHYAQDALGDVVYAQLPDIDTEILKKDECGALESVKAASELYSPVSGRVVEKNIAVEETPALINQSCYEKGWLFKIELKNPDELKELMTESEYENFLKTDAH
ncbi:glycine cleavage system H protein, mitochondrial isoform X2 [Zootermopsis nevadensis]|uniref:glycine cleavage system H protein, mitochondrial isoform X2 n=1 Tax=Zootermopsis nevadensis TaxID=136037 RepID=UPI000B8E761F|nr:glycine cleavage system H protein, mitochondrial isoform X2 [Zootermopsis nevadensis]